MTSVHIAITLVAIVAMVLGMACSSPLRTGKSIPAGDAGLPSAEQALTLLKQGNRRFVEERPRHDQSSGAYRASLVEGQQPFAVIVGCADSRVPVELVFDTGFGDLFVCRNAGNVMASDIIGSIAYAVDHLHTPLVVVMGHEGCGAVTAALAPEEERAAEAHELQAVLRMIDPAIAHLKGGEYDSGTLTQAVEANVRHSVAELERLRDSTGIPKVMDTRIVGAVYELDSGRVRFLGGSR